MLKLIMQLKTVISPDDLRKKTGQVLLPFSKAGYKYTPENSGKIFSRLGDPPLPYFYVISTPLCGVGGKDTFKLKIGVSNAKSKMSRLATYARHYGDTQEGGFRIHHIRLFQRWSDSNQGTGLHVLYESKIKRECESAGMKEMARASVKRQNPDNKEWFFAGDMEKLMGVIEAVDKNPEWSIKAKLDPKRTSERVASARTPAASTRSKT